MNDPELARYRPPESSGSSRFKRRTTLDTKAEDVRKGMDLNTIVWWIVFGGIVGLVARFLMPGPDPMGGVGTIVLGIIGSFVGGFLGQLLFAGNASLPPPSAGWIGSIIGALIALAVYRSSQGRRVVT